MNSIFLLKKNILLLDILLLILCVIALPCVTLLVLTYPPTIESQGQAHRIFYIHVPIAWVALYAPLFAAISSILYLYKKNLYYHIYTIANMKLALLFALCVIISGPLWAYTEWGTYWNWKDSRLITFALLLFMLLNYFLAIQMTENLTQKASIGSTIAILTAFVSILTWYSIRLIQPDTHPPPVLHTLSPKIKMSFWLSVIAYHIFFLFLLRILIYLEKLSLFNKILLAHINQKKGT